MKLAIKIFGIAIILGFFLGGPGIPTQVKAGNTGQGQIPEPNPQYFTANTIRLSNGTSLEEYIINGPPTPPVGYDLERGAVALPGPDRAATANSLTVPAFPWVYGCSAVSAAMIAAYYDRTGYSNLYTGSTNGGVMPLDSSLWPSWTDSVGHLYPQNPLIASRQGLDGRPTRGSLDDYWFGYTTNAQDPYLSSGWAQHTWGDAIGDFMKTSQSGYGNVDGSTVFYNYNSASPLTCADMVGYGIHILDGTYGRKLFYEAKGYSVAECYNQKTDNTVSGGFSFGMYKAEIDSGRPVLLNLAGHSIVEVGYNDAGNKVYIHDTWDSSTYPMTWGGSYSGMGLLSVSIVNIAPASFNKSGPSNGATGQSTNVSLSWAPSNGATRYEYCYDSTNDGDCSNWQSAGTNTSVNLNGLNGLTTYYWQVRAFNSSSTYANGTKTSFWSFTTLPAPGTFSKITPGQGATSQTTSLILSWEPSSSATNYEYCSDFASGGLCANWKSAGTDTSIEIDGLTSDSRYNWQVRAWNGGAGPVYADDGNWWEIEVQPEQKVFLPLAVR